MEQKLLNIQQAATFLGVNIRTIRRWAQKNKVRGLKVGARGDWRFTEEDLLKLVKESKENAMEN